MSETSGGLPLMAQTQNSRYLTFNELAWAVNVLQTGVLDRDLTSPPGSPSEGDAYIVDSPAAGAWAGHENDIAFFFGGIWNFLSPEIGQGRGIWVVDEELMVQWASGSPTGWDIPNSSTPAFGTIAVSGQTDVVADSASDTLTLVAGSNITLTTNAGSKSVTIAASGGGGGSTKYRKVFRPRDNEPPSTNYATLDTRNGHPVLDFDTTTQEAAIFSDMISAGYGGGDITVAVTAALTSATSGTLGWDVTFERVGTAQDIDSDSWATAQTITAATVPGTSGFLITLSVSITAGATGTDSLAAGEAYRLRIRRDVANDTATGDAELWAVVVSEN